MSNDKHSSSSKSQNSEVKNNDNEERSYYSKFKNNNDEIIPILVKSNEHSHRSNNKRDTNTTRYSYKSENSKYSSKSNNLSRKKEFIVNNRNKNDTDIAKIFISVMFVVFLSIFNNSPLANHFEKPVTCFNDAVFNLTEGINNSFNNNLSLNNAIMIIGGLLEDLTVLSGFIFFCFGFKSWALLIALTFVYSFRIFIQKIYVMDFPVHTTFKDPGFPSLFVPYLPTTDFFFSGHVSLPTVVAFQFYFEGYKALSYFSFFAGFYQACMMIATRGHYSIDLFAGFIFSFYFCILTKILCVKYIDNSGIGLYEDGKNEGIDKREINKEELNSSHYSNKPHKDNDYDYYQDNFNDETRISGRSFNEKTDIMKSDIEEGEFLIKK